MPNSKSSALLAFALRGVFHFMVYGLGQNAAFAEEVVAVLLVYRMEPCVRASFAYQGAACFRCLCSMRWPRFGVPIPYDCLGVRVSLDKQMRQ